MAGRDIENYARGGYLQEQSDASSLKNTLNVTASLSQSSFRLRELICAAEGFTTSTSNFRIDGSSQQEFIFTLFLALSAHAKFPDIRKPLPFSGISLCQYNLWNPLCPSEATQREEYIRS